MRIVQKYISGNGGDTDSREFQRVLVLAADVLTYTEWGEGGRGECREYHYIYIHIGTSHKQTPRDGGALVT